MKSSPSSLCPGRESNPYGHCWPRDFKSRVSTFSTTWAWLCKDKKIINFVHVMKHIGIKAFLCIAIVASVTMACKAHLRNGGPLLLAPATNDALTAAAPNIATLLARRNVYFVPLRQDDPLAKPTSAIADFSLLPDAVEAALAGRQLQPVFK